MTELRTANETDYADDNEFPVTKSTSASGLFKGTIANLRKAIFGLLAGASTAGYVWTVGSDGESMEFAAPAGGGGASYPPFAGNKGKVLTVNAGETGVEWDASSGGGGGGGGALTPIATVTVGAGGQPSIDFANIPQTFTDLKLTGLFETTGQPNVTSLNLVVNGDTGNDYNWTIDERAAFYASSQDSKIELMRVYSSGGNSIAPNAAMIDITIPEYASGLAKLISGTVNYSAGLNANGGTSTFGALSSGLWAKRDAINELTMTLGDGTNFLQGTKVTLWGIANSAAGGGIADAPNDGKMYARQNGAWVAFTAGGGGGSGPAIRGSNMQVSNADHQTIPFPAGSVAGDYAILHAGTGYDVTTPTGWTQLNHGNSGHWGGATLSKTLTADDITAGSVNVNLQGPADCFASMIVFDGSTVTLADQVEGGTTDGGGALTTPNPVDTNTMVVYMSSGRGSSACTVDHGTKLQQQNDGGGASAVLYAGIPSAAGPITANFVAPAPSYYSMITIPGKS